MIFLAIYAWAVTGVAAHACGNWLSESPRKIKDLALFAAAAFLGPLVAIALFVYLITDPD